MSHKKPIKHWTTKQDLQYYIFLVVKFRQLIKNKKETKIYVEMARFIKLKNSTQCRTHHEKKLKELKLGNGREDIEVLNLRRFYNENYTIRRLKEDHLKHEILLCLREKRMKRIISKQEYLDYMGRVDEAIAELAFEASAEKLRLEQRLPQINRADIFDNESEMTDLQEKESKDEGRMVPDFEPLDGGYELYYFESQEY